MIKNSDILLQIKKLKRPIFTTFELSRISGISASAVSQQLARLVRRKLLVKLCRGIWADSARDDLSPYSLVPFLFVRGRAYVSFVSALHLYGIIEQVPQVITLAVTDHTKIIRTALGVFECHQINPEFFSGFNWYNDEGSYLIAEPEKALVDCLYLASHKTNRFGAFPELHFSRSFSFKKAESWLSWIKNQAVRRNMKDALELLRMRRRRA